MAACVVLLAGATAGRAVVGDRKGLPASVAVIVAAIAAAIGPLLLNYAARYPGWYPFLWIFSIGALALTRASRGVMLAAAAVAALGAATLTWSSSIKQRLVLAERDVAAASVIDPTASFLLERFGRSLASGRAPSDRAGLLRAYVTSDLAAVPYPLELFVWDSTNKVDSRLSLSRISAEPELQLETVEAARRSGLVVQREVNFIPGAQMLIAAPHPSGWVTTAVVAPRTRIVRDEPYLSLLGLAQEQTGEPPYTISLTPLEERAERRVTRGSWERRGDALHGEWDLPDYRGGVHADVEVDLRSYDVLLQRGTLVLLSDLLLFVVLWALAVAADGSLSRWLRSRRHLWGRSYRARLTLALFGFFTIPAGVFAVWSHRTVLSGDRQARELVLTEKLRAAEEEASAGMLGAASEAAEAPLFVYENGRLVTTSDSLFLQLSPLSRRLAPAVFTAVELDERQTASEVHEVGESRALVSYRRVHDPNQGAMVLAAPARADDLTIDRRSRDLGVLALFITAVGAVAALLLSGFAARQLARPIGILRGAALAIARGERTAPLPQEPRSEFAAVFSAFNTMATDLSSSRGQLVAAQRRTEAILRNVASGVIAFDRDAHVTLANPRSGALLGARLDAGMTLHDVKLPLLEEQVGTFLAGVEEDREFDMDIGGRQMHGWLTRLASGDGGAVLTLDDVSEMARAQRVLAWGQMARQVAHEIKNPLTPIRLGVQHLRRAHMDRHADFDRILDSNVARILAEIDRLDEIARAFSRYGVAPTQRQDVSPVDVGDIARDVVALERMGEGDVQWRYDESEGSLLALASEDELREVLLNLLENARHANAAVVTMTVSHKAATLVIEVVDDGHGIPQDVLPRIFEPNFSTRSSGSGLGLAISRKLIEGWGGQISVTSTPGNGARVTIVLLAPREL
jgi:signal transduction histidine kinase